MIVQAVLPPTDAPEMLARRWQLRGPRVTTEFAKTVSIGARPGVLARKVAPILAPYRDARRSFDHDRREFLTHLARAQPIATALERRIEFERPTAPTWSGRVAGVVRGGERAATATTCVTVGDDWMDLEVRSVPLELALELIPTLHRIRLIPRPSRVAEARTDPAVPAPECTPTSHLRPRP